MFTKGEKNKIFNSEFKVKNSKMTNIGLIIVLAIIFAWITLSVFLYLIGYIGGKSNASEFETKIIDVNTATKDWYKNDKNLDLFTVKNNDGEKIIWPGQTGSTEFIVKNTYNEDLIYKLGLYEKNPYNINIKYRIKLNNVYVLSSENKWLTPEEVRLEEIKLPKNSESVYTLEWTWEENGKDENLIKEDNITYAVYLEVYSKCIANDIL